MEMHQIIEQAERNIRQALADYGKHTNRTEVLDNVTNAFIKGLAQDSSYAKRNLRELFSKSPVWDESIDALVINGARTHNPDSERILELGNRILFSSEQKDHERISRALLFFAHPNDTYWQERGLKALIELAPKAYAPGKKLSRVFKALCKELGVADETAGSEFQRLYAQFADELSTKKICFKLYASINPAHFLTMSNPKGDDRGETLTSCHSFNQTDYEYANGCIGYARDEVTFIVFTVSDPSDPETLNNRKTTRQIFAYRPGNGLLLQSRMYNTSGGTTGAQEESRLYRDLIQREISMLEGAVNLWNTYPSYCGDHEHDVDRGTGFGGYADWTCSDFDGKVSIRKDRADDYEPLEVGTFGRCIRCGCEIDTKLYCEDCDPENEFYCDCCRSHCTGESHGAYNEHGHLIEVCDSCFNRLFTRCEECEEYFPTDGMLRLANGDLVCEECRYKYCTLCEECDEFYRDDDIYTVYNERGREVSVCEDCRERLYTECESCGEYFHNDTICECHNADGDTFQRCGSCAEENFEICPECGEWIELREDGTCPACGAVIVEHEEKEKVLV